MSTAVLFLAFGHLVLARHAHVKNDEYLVEHHGHDLNKEQAQIVKRQRYGLPEITISSWAPSQTDSQLGNFNIGQPSTFMNNATPTYIFPSTVIQVAVATLCPYNVSANISGLHTSDPTAGFANLTYITTSTDPTATLTPMNATAAISDVTASTTTAANDSTTNSNPQIELNVTAGIGSRIGQTDESDIDPNIARIVQGDDNCQTIYAPQTTTFCSTTVNLVGLPPVSVTDCNQWITFSTAGSPACTAFPVQPPPALATNTTYSINAPQKFVPRVAGPANVSLPIPPSVLPTNSIPSVHDTIYYVAHWWDLISNHVPSIVRVEDCPDAHIGDACAAHTESWEIGNELKTTTGMSAIAYTGPVVFTYGTWTFNTTIAIDTTMTTTGILTVPTISRKTLGGDGTTSASVSLTTSEESTVTMSVLVPTTRTYTVEPIPARTSTIIHDTTITITTTVYPSTSTQG